MAFSRLYTEHLAGRIARLTIRGLRENMSIIYDNRLILLVSADTV